MVHILARNVVGNLHYWLSVPIPSAPSFSISKLCFSTSRFFPFYYFPVKGTTETEQFKLTQTRKWFMPDSDLLELPSTLSWFSLCKKTNAECSDTCYKI